MLDTDYPCHTWTQRPGEPGPRGEHDRRRDRYAADVRATFAARDLFVALVDAIDALAAVPDTQRQRYALLREAETAGRAYSSGRGRLIGKAERHDGYYVDGAGADDRRRTSPQLCPTCRAWLDDIARLRREHYRYSDALLRITDPATYRRRHAAEAKRVRGAWLDDNCEPDRAAEW